MSLKGQPVVRQVDPFLTVAPEENHSFIWNCRTDFVYLPPNNRGEGADYEKKTNCPSFGPLFRLLTFELRFDSK